MLATFALQQLTNEEIDSSSLYLVASNSHLDILISALKATESRAHDNLSLSF